MLNLRCFALACVVAGLVASGSASPVQAGLFHHRNSDCCEPQPVCQPEPVCCEPQPVCCPTPPPPVEVCWCVVDPCTGCTYQVEACVPACCAGVTPCLVDWRKGIFGRKVLTYKFECCDHCVDVVVTKHGRTIVRD